MWLCAFCRQVPIRISFRVKEGEENAIKKPSKVMKKPVEKNVEVIRAFPAEG